MRLCYKAAQYAGMIFGTIAIIFVLFGVVGYIVWYANDAAFLKVANFWNYLYASIPFSLVAICCMLFVLAAKNKE